MPNSESKKYPIKQVKPVRKRKSKNIKMDSTERKFLNDLEGTPEAKFRNFLNNLDDIAYEADETGIVTYANKTAEKITGIPLKDIVGKPFLPLFTQKSQQTAVDVYERTLGGESTEYELTFTNGRICHFKNEPLEDENGKINRVFGIARDITRSKQLEKTLRASEERFKNLFNNALVGLYRTTPDGQILMANPALVRMLGYGSFEDLAGRNLEEEGFEPQYTRSDFKRRIDAEGRIIGLEADWIRRDGTILSIRESAKAIRDEYGNILYYEGTVEEVTERIRAEKELKKHHDQLEEMVTKRTRELERNNKALQTEINERRQTEKALRMSELRFRSLIEQTTDSVFCYEYEPPIPTYLPLEQQVRFLYDGVLVECNDVCAKSYGTNRAEEVIGKRLTELFGTMPGSLDKLFSEMIEGGYRIVDGEGVEKFEDGTERYYLNNAHGVIENGKLVRIWGTFRDVTDRKKAQEKLRQYEFMVESAHDAIFFKDKQSRYIIANKKTLESFGLPREKVIGKSDNEIMPAREQAKNNIDDDKIVFETGQPKEIIKEMTDADGKQYWFQAVKVPHFDENGNVVGLIGIARDITERMQAEEELKIREQKLRALLNAPTESAILVDVNGTILDINRIAAKRLGKSVEELIGIGIYDYLPTEIAEFRKTRGQEVINTGKPLRFQDGHDGRYYDNNIYPVFNDEGKVNAVAVFSQDITEHKQAEEALRESEEKFRSLAEQSPNMIFINKRGRIVYVNNKCEDVMGYKREELCSEGFDFLSLIAPESLDLIKEKFAQHSRGQEVQPYDYSIIRKDGERIEAINSSKLIHYEGQTAILGVVTDISEHKKTERALRESEQKYSSFLKHFMGIAYRGNVETWIPLFFHGAVEEITGYKESEFLAGKPRWDKVIHPDDLCRMTIEGSVEKIRSIPDFSNTREYRIIRKDGQIRWVHEMFRNISDDSGKPVIVEGCIYDVTERRRVEQALRESEERLKILFESAPDAIYLIDSEGKIVDGNRAAEELIGFSKQEVIGKSLAEIGLLSGQQLSRAQANLKEVASGEVSGPNEYILTRKDNSQVSVEVRTFPVKINGKMLTLGIARDITKHKQTEKKLLGHQAELKSLASQLSLTEERERHRLATDLHDQISQSLVISKIKLDQLRKMSNSSQSIEPLQDISNCLEQIIDDTRALTFDLSYPILYELGFEAAVAEWLTDQIQEKHEIETEFKDDWQEKPLDDDIRVLLFRNVRELLINVIKHAEASKIKVSIHRDNEYINVKVEDDGVGFDPVEVTSMAAKRAEFGLFSIKERLEQLGGMIKIESRPGCGSKITMIAPLKSNSSPDRICE